MTASQERLPTCREIVELITDYLEGNLSLDVRGRVEQHLTWCRGCRNYLKQMRVTISLTGSLAEESLPADVRDQLVLAFRGWRS